MYNTSQPFDKFIIMNNRFPNNEEIEEMKKKYFNLLDLEKMIKKNEKIRDIANKNNVDYLNFFELACSIKEKKCNYLDSNMNKIHKTEAGHFTKEGLNYFSKLVGDKIIF